VASCDKIIACVKFIAWRACENATELVTKERIQVVGGATGFNPPPPPQQIEIYKTQFFLDVIILYVVRDLLFSRNEPLKSAGD
jgi:hypothetical protein